MRLPIGEELFQSGLLVMGCALGLFLIAACLMVFAFRKLKRKLDQEYGKKRH